MLISLRLEMHLPLHIVVSLPPYPFCIYFILSFYLYGCTKIYFIHKFGDFLFATDSESEEEVVSPVRNDLTEYRNSYKDDELVSLCLKPYGYAL